MPQAGNNSANRAKAHLQWADRYSRYGDTQKAAAHFGRALEYDRRNRGRGSNGQEFGGFEVDGHQIDFPNPFSAATSAVTKAAQKVGGYIWPPKSAPDDRPLPKPKRGLDDTPPYSKMKEKYKQWTLVLGTEPIDPFFNENGIPLQPGDEARYNAWVKLGAEIGWTLAK